VVWMVVECLAVVAIDCFHQTVVVWDLQEVTVVLRWAIVGIENLQAGKVVSNVLHHEVVWVSGLLVVQMASRCLVEAATVACD